MLAALLLAALQLSGAEWQAKWISRAYSPCAANTWIAFQKKVELGSVPAELPAKIAADSKYWLWVNGEMVVVEGGLKRGPAPGDGYYDTVDIAPYLKSGENVISVLVWYFGRNGFSPSLRSYWRRSKDTFGFQLGCLRPFRLRHRIGKSAKLPPERKQRAL